MHKTHVARNYLQSDEVQPRSISPRLYVMEKFVMKFSVQKINKLLQMLDTDLQAANKRLQKANLNDLKPTIRTTSVWYKVGHFISIFSTQSENLTLQFDS